MAFPAEDDQLKAEQARLASVSQRFIFKLDELKALTTEKVAVLGARLRE